MNTFSEANRDRTRVLMNRKWNVCLFSTPLLYFGVDLVSGTIRNDDGSSEFCLCTLVTITVFNISISSTIDPHFNPLSAGKFSEIVYVKLKNGQRKIRTKNVNTRDIFHYFTKHQVFMN